MTTRQRRSPTLPPVPLPLDEIFILIATGLVAGILGGLLGIGGSIVMIPVLTLLLDRSQHLAQACAMLVNIAVALPSAFRHHQAKAVRWDVVKRFLPVAIVMIIVGVLVSDQFEGTSEITLKRIFGLFLVYVITTNLLHLWHRTRNEEPTALHGEVSWWRCGIVGGITGFMAGLLGIGGGIIAVPLLQRVCRLRLREAIATSSTVMVLTAIVGATQKNGTLPTHGQSIADSVIMAATLAPTAILGGYLGAKLTHTLPLTWVRAAFLVLLTWAAWQMITGG